MLLRSLRSYTVIAMAAMASAIIAVPAGAQQTDPATIRELEKKLDDLLDRAAALRAEIEQLKSTMTPPAETPPAEDLTAIDLTNVDVVTPAEPEPQTATAAATPSVENVQPIENAAAPASSGKLFNPDMSVIGTVASHAGDSNPFEYGSEEMRAPFDLGEVEMALEAFVDPYAKGKFFLSIGDGGIEVEEGYAEFLTLPWDLSAKVGKKKAVFGKANTWHTHIRPWVDQPLVIHNFFGDEGLADTGVSVSKIFPTESVYAELTAEVLSGAAEGVFERQNDNDLFYNTHLRFFRDLTENSNLELGTSYARGTGADSGATSQFAGVDVSYRWKPLQNGLYRGFIGRFEAMTNDRDDLEDRLTGYYASAEWRLAQRWIVGARLDRADRAYPVIENAGPMSRFTDRGASLLLTFQPSEFSQVRGQIRRTSYDEARSVTEFLLQLQFAIGAHGAHTF